MGMNHVYIFEYTLKILLIHSAYTRYKMGIHTFCELPAKHFDITNIPSQKSHLYVIMTKWSPSITSIIMFRILKLLGPTKVNEWLEEILSSSSWQWSEIDSPIFHFHYHRNIKYFLHHNIKYFPRVCVSISKVQLAAAAKLTTSQMLIN